MKPGSAIPVGIGVFSILTGVYSLREAIQEERLRPLLICGGLLMLASGAFFVWVGLK